ncbi:MIP/aquaporin family protein [Romboutsia sedimentorum]|uniref:MIP/aquaporin family protein n=1 Tax=Romboutsia sedimentorum TaxID=1368474 RepID=UPI0024DEC9FA|nr:MIP/aquaporin family protein [Romboutsia sedimentorum]MDK2585253.1 MIP/aquaporin family protein [Romboutsia sedimentorum]
MNTSFFAELIGTMMLVLLGDAVVANVILKNTKGHNGGIISITAGWAFAVAIPVFIFGNISGAHFNPAVTIALASIGNFPWADVPMYLIAQCLGAFIGAALVLVSYFDHFKLTDDKATKLGVFCTSPEVRNLKLNFVTEFIGTFILMFAILGIGASKLADGISPMAVGIVVWGIGLSLGGPTGYAINPARDLGPRLAHFLLPVPDKGDSDWRYALIPVIGPICGAVFSAFVYNMIF